METSFTTTRVTVWVGLVAAISVLGGTGCTEAEFQNIPQAETERDDELELSGSYCTREPETLKFPVRLLFLVDISHSMQTNDPPDKNGKTGREKAVRGTWERMLEDQSEGVKAGITGFSSTAQPLTANSMGADTRYFTNDPKALGAATDKLADTARTTDYLNVLGEAYTQLQSEMLRAQSTNPESLPLSKYVVIFLSDGIPDREMSAQREGSNEQIVEAVEALEGLADSFDVGEFSFNTAYVAKNPRREDEELLKAMAEAGGGRFRSFPSGAELNFLFADLSVLKRAFTLESLAAVNVNTLMNRSQIPDPRRVLRDGYSVRRPSVADGGEVGDVGTFDGSVDVAGLDAASVVGPDADGSPFAMRKPRPHPMSFVDLDNSKTVECGEPMVDTDGDGLADIAERRAGTDPFYDDTDEDGLHDILEWRQRDGELDPVEKTDSQCFAVHECKDDGDGNCQCINDSDGDGTCDCENDPTTECMDDAGHDCIDENDDGICDCRDPDGDGRCDYRDRDGDGLHDCEEVFVGTSKKKKDTDSDGLLDFEEVRFNTNPSEKDLQDNYDADSTSNKVEVLSNTDPNCDDARFRSKAAYRYNLSEADLDGAQSCYDFRVDNITLVPTLDRADAPAGEDDGDDEDDKKRYPGNGWNRILVYSGEVAFDDPSAFAVYRVACVMANYHPNGNYKNPPSGQMRLTEDDFVEVRNFDPQKHCKWP